jgi:hypothetical protein
MFIYFFYGLGGSDLTQDGFLDTKEVEALVYTEAVRLHSV